MIRSSRTQSIAGWMSEDQMTTRESVTHLSLPECAPLLHTVPSFGMMQSHACDVGTNRAERSHAAFRVHSAIHQHRRLMVGRLADHVLRLRDPVLALDQRVRADRALGILPDARSQGAAEFQNYRNDLWGGDACWEFLLFLQNRTGGVLRFRSCSSAFLSADGIRATNVYAAAARRAPPDYGLHVVRSALCALAFQFHHQNCVSHSAFEQRPAHRAILCVVPDRGHQVLGHGRIFDGECNWAAFDGAPHQREKNLGRFFRCDCLRVALQPGSLQTDARTFVRAELDACDSAWAATG